MSEFKQNIDEQNFDRPTDPPPYTDPPTIPVMNQPQMSVMYQSVPGMTSIGSVGVVTGQPGVMTSVGMVGQTGGIRQVGMVTGQPGTMSMVAGFVVLGQMVYQPTPYTCRSCHQQIVTKVKRKPTFKTHFIAAGFCLVCLIPCAITPYFVDSCRLAGPPADMNQRTVQAVTVS